MYLLDTNHCSQIIRGNAALSQQLQTRLSNGVATSVIVRGELLYMVWRSEQQADNLRTITAFLGFVA